MNKLPYHLFLFFIICFISCSRSSSEKFQYNSISEESEFESIFAADGKEFYYGADTAGKVEIRHTTFSTLAIGKFIVEREEHKYFQTS